MDERGINTRLGPWHTRVFALWLGEGRVPSENVATPELVAFGVGEPGFLQAGRGSAVGKPEQSTTAPPLRSF